MQSQAIVPLHKQSISALVLSLVVLVHIRDFCAQTSRQPCWTTVSPPEGAATFPTYPFWPMWYRLNPTNVKVENTHWES